MSLSAHHILFTAYLFLVLWMLTTRHALLIVCPTELSGVQVHHDPPIRSIIFYFFQSPLKPRIFVQGSKRGCAGGQCTLRIGLKVPAVLTGMLSSYSISSPSMFTPRKPYWSSRLSTAKRGNCFAFFHSSAFMSAKVAALYQGEKASRGHASVRLHKLDNN